MNWKLKGLAQKGLSFVPGGTYLNSGLQKKCGGLRNLEENIVDKLEDWRLSMRYLQHVGFELEGASIVEIGTGWFPTLPICFSLVGAKRIQTFDIARHIDSGLTFQMVTSLESKLDGIAEIGGVRAEDVRARYHELVQSRDLDGLLEKARVEYSAPADARAMGSPRNSADLVYSNSVLEHVPKQIIRSLMEETVRVLRPEGLTLHNVGCNDHYAFVDRKISFVNYLRYSEAQWGRWNNCMQYQNRLRALEFLELAREAGLEVIYEQIAVRPGTLEALTTFEVAQEFQRFSREQLAITTVDFIARKPGCMANPSGFPETLPAELAANRQNGLEGLREGLPAK
jgi:ubiquinone/menaquinone biosynthesis C-methylase UbiE